MSRGVGRIQRHMEYIANTIEAMLDLLEIIQNLPAARNRDLVALLAIGCLVALSLLRVMAAARKLLAHVHAWGRHTRHGLRENGGGGGTPRRPMALAPLLGGPKPRRTPCPPRPYAAQDPLRGGTRTGGMTGGTRHR